MKKLIILLVAIALVIVLILILSQAPAPSNQSSNSILEDAYAGKLSLSCEYILEELSAKTNVYVKGSQIRVDTISEDGQRFDLIYAPDKTYFWQEESGIGFAFPAIDESQEAQAYESVQSKKDIQEEIQKYQQFCKEADLKDSIFSPPTNIDFQEIGSFSPLSQ